MSKSHYQYKNILRSFESILENEHLKITSFITYSKDSVQFVLQQVFQYYLNNEDSDYFLTPSLFLERLSNIQFQKELYFLINYIEETNNLDYKLIDMDLSEIKHSLWYLS